MHPHKLKRKILLLTQKTNNNVRKLNLLTRVAPHVTDSGGSRIQCESSCTHITLKCPLNVAADAVRSARYKRDCIILRHITRRLNLRIK